MEGDSSTAFALWLSHWADQGSCGREKLAWWSPWLLGPYTASVRAVGRDLCGGNGDEASVMEMFPVTCGFRVGFA